MEEEGPAIIKELIGAKADVDAQTTDDLLTPLHFAASEGFVDNALALLDGNATATSKSVQLVTPLHLASRNVDVEEMVPLILKLGGDVNSTTNSSWTPLHFAAYWGNAAGVQLLLEEGAYAEALTESGEAPADVVCLCAIGDGLSDLTGDLSFFSACSIDACLFKEQEDNVHAQLGGMVTNPEPEPEEASPAEDVMEEDPQVQKASVPSRPGGSGSMDEEKESTGSTASAVPRVCVVLLLVAIPLAMTR